MAPPPSSSLTLTPTAWNTTHSPPPWTLRPPTPARTDQKQRGGNRSGDCGLDQLDDLLLYHGTPLLERVRHRPQVPVVEVGCVLEADGRVPVIELARVLKEDD